MSKRFAVFVLMCLFLSGCAGKPDMTQPTATEQPAAESVVTEQTIGELTVSEAMRDYNAQNQFRGIAPRIISFQETEMFFCGSGFMGNIIYYYDKISGISGVLCADPACTHESSSCGAFADYGSFFCDGEVRYWIGEDSQGYSRDNYLWSGDLSGMNREKVKRLSFEDIILQYQPQHYEIHRGRFYILGDSSIVDGVSSRQRVTLLSSSVDDSESFEVLFDETFERNVHPSIRFVGDSAYLTLQIFPQGGPFDLTILKINTKSGEAETIYEETGMTESIDPAWVTEQGEIYLPGRNDACAYIWKLQNGKRVEIACWEYPDPSSPSIFDGIASFVYRLGDERWIDIINLSGEVLYSGKLFQESVPEMEGDPNKYSYAEVGGDADKIILNLQNFTDRGLVDYTVMLDLKENLKATVLWRSQR